MEDSALREQLVTLLRGGEAHVKAEPALADVNSQFWNARPAAEVHSIWEDLEHMRIAQEDILRFTVDPSWKSPEWTAGYWPAKTEVVFKRFGSGYVLKEIWIEGSKEGAETVPVEAEHHLAKSESKGDQHVAARKRSDTAKNR